MKPAPTRKCAPVAVAVLASVVAYLVEAPTPTRAASAIQHVVILDEENHSFNDILGKFCIEQSRGQITRDGVNDSCTGTTQGQVSGSTSPYTLTSEPDVGLLICHSVRCQAKAVDAGKMDGFSTISGCTASSTPAYGCLSQFDPLSGPCASSNGSCIPNIATYATKYAISDATFTSDAVPSWAGHMILGSASIERFVGDNPSKYPGKLGKGWGCDSGDTTAWKNPDGSTVQVPSCVPNTSGSLGSVWSGWTGQTAYYEPTIFDRMDSAGVSWKIYGGDYSWSICPTFEECVGGPQRSHLVSSVNAKKPHTFAGGPLASDIANGALPAVSYVIPTGTYSGHQPHAMSAGDNWIGSVVSAIQANSSLWQSTAIFVTFDDCGCFYDPVNPLKYNPEWGPRVPLLIISPYARAGYTDSTPASFGSLLAFVEQTFNLTPLNPCATVDSWDPNCTDDVRGPSTVNGGVTYTFRDAFNLAQSPLPASPAVSTHLTPLQRSYLRDHPYAGDGAT